jgi:C4-dicarboxylate-specific signal transduction histidine kinase
VDLNEVVREALQILSAQAAARDVRLDSKLAPERVRVNGDRVQLHFGRKSIQRRSFSR